MKHVSFLLLALMLWQCQPGQQESTAHATAEQLVMATAYSQLAAEKAALDYQTYQLAQLRLNEQLAQAPDSLPLAIITDVDETVLDNSPYQAMLVHTGQSFSPETWQQWVARAEAKALPGAVDFFQYAASQGVAIFYITNRSASQNEATLKNLQAEGFPMADEKHLLAKTETSDKTARRRQVTSRYQVILYLGDNLRDFDEQFAQRKQAMGKDVVKTHREHWGADYIVFANPMYGEWEKALYGGTYPETETATAAERRNILNGF